MIGLKHVLHEDDLALVPTKATAGARRRARGRGARRRGRPAGDRNSGLALPRAVIFRDSFASPLAPFLSEHFSRAVYLWQNDFDANAVAEGAPRRRDPGDRRTASLRLHALARSSSRPRDGWTVLVARQRLVIVPSLRPLTALSRPRSRCR